MKKLVSALFALALFSSMALATVPYPPYCVVTPCDALNGVVMCPDTPAPIPASIVNMTIRNQSNNVIPNASVNITIASGPFCFCNTMVYNTTTNNQGYAQLTLRAGGCLQNVDQAAVIRSNGAIVRNYRNAKSPDWDGAAGNCRVDLADYLRFVARDLCHDYDNTGVVDVSDFVLFASGFSPGHICTP